MTLPATKFSFAAVLLCVAAAHAQAQPEEKNWFADPFFQISNAIAPCPLPAGPYVTEREMRLQSHRRAEKGATCWLAGRCTQPSAYLYDPGIAQALKAALAAQPAAARTSLWATVQGRVVYLEGCAHTAADVAQLEAAARAVADVDQVIAIVRTDTARRTPYRVRAGL